jgi:hypothetical protein
MKKILTLSLLRIVALVGVVVGAIGSLGLVLHAGRKNNSVILPILFVIWVLFPFIVLIVANLFSTRWPVIIRIALYRLTIVLTLISLVAYSGLLTPPQSKPAGVFLIVPLLSLVAMAAVVAWSRRTINKSDGV